MIYSIANGNIHCRPPRVLEWREPEELSHGTMRGVLSVMRNGSQLTVSQFDSYIMHTGPCELCGRDTSIHLNLLSPEARGLVAIMDGMRVCDVCVPYMYMLMLSGDARTAFVGFSDKMHTFDIFDRQRPKPVNVDARWRVYTASVRSSPGGGVFYGINNESVVRVDTPEENHQVVNLGVCQIRHMFMHDNTLIGAIYGTNIRFVDLRAPSDRGAVIRVAEGVSTAAFLSENIFVAASEDREYTFDIRMGAAICEHEGCCRYSGII